MILLISLLVFQLMFTNCGWIKSIFGPDDPNEIEQKFVRAEIKYQRVDDDPNCPIVYPDLDEHVYLNGDLSAAGPKLIKIGDNLFVYTDQKVRVNYPVDRYGGNPYKVFVLDNVFPRGHRARAHLIWINGCLMTKIHKLGDEEYLYIRIDESSIPHEE